MKKQILLLAYCLFFSCINSYGQTTTVYYVDAAKSDNSGSGLSWTAAKRDIQAAIFLADSDDQVWVKKGTYKPTHDHLGNSNPTIRQRRTFYIKDGIKLYGGFAGTETALTQRTSGNVTILSGDFNSNDIYKERDSISPRIANNTDNAYHLILASPTIAAKGITIDGFTMTGGGATILSPSPQSFTVNSNTIYDERYGVMAIFYGKNTITNNIITKNNSHYDLILLAGGSDSFAYNTIVKNISQTICYKILGVNNFSNNAFNGNTSYYELRTDNGRNILRNNVFGYGDETCVFTSKCTNTYINNTFTLHYSGVRTFGYIDTFINNIFWGTRFGYLAGDFGDFQNNTYNGVLSAVFFKNNILQHDSSQYFSGGLTTLGTGSSGNLVDQDPHFVDPLNPAGLDGVFRTDDDGLRLLTCSHAIGTGFPVAKPEVDFLDTFRQASSINMGAYYLPVPCRSDTILYVDSSVIQSNIGASWNTAFKTLDEANYYAWKCPSVKEIRVARGTYYPSSFAFDMEPNGIGARSKGDVLTLHIRTGLSVFGGYATGGGQRNPSLYPTVLSGAGTHNPPHLTLRSRSSHILFIDSSKYWNIPNSITTIDGFTIQNGYAVSGWDEYKSYVNKDSVNRHNGGGIYINSGTNIISNNIFKNDSTSDGGKGAAIYAHKSFNTFTGNFFLKNIAQGWLYNSGGAIFTDTCSNIITNNVFKDNFAYQGGAINTFVGKNTIANNTFSKNKASSSGGGIYTVLATNRIINNIFHQNSISGNSGAVTSDCCSFASISNTYLNNILQLYPTLYTPLNNNNLGTNSGNLFLVDPVFITASKPEGWDHYYRTEDDGMVVSAYSPAVHAGIPTTEAIHDILGVDRDTVTPTIGAYEMPYMCSNLTELYVDSSISNPGDGSSWATAEKSLDHALTKAWNCHSIKHIFVAKGTYKPSAFPYVFQANAIAFENINTDNRFVTFHLRPGLSLIGGFPNGGGVRDFKIHPTVLNGDLESNDSINTNENAYNVVYIDSSKNYTDTNGSVTIDGFRIRGGSTGVNVNNGTICIKNNRIYESTTGIFVDSSNCEISYNTIENNNNVGLGLMNSNYIVNNNFIVKNSKGGLVNYGNGRGLISNNVLAKNSGQNIGGGIQLTNPIYVDVINNTIVENGTINQLGAGLYIKKNTMSGSFINNVFWKNWNKVGPDTTSSDIYLDGNSSNTVWLNNSLQESQTSYTSIRTGYLGANPASNLFQANPLFVNESNPAGADGIYTTSDDGFRIFIGSPLIAGGSSTLSPPKDILEEIRSAPPTIGAYERDSSSCMARIPPNTSITNLQVCSAILPYQWNGASFYKAGSSLVHLLTKDGCDSFAILNLSLLSYPYAQLLPLTNSINASPLNGKSYRWLDCKNGFSVISGETTAVLPITHNGSYAVEISLGECIDTSDCVQVTWLGTYNQEQIPHVLVLPNPVNNNLTITIDAKQFNCQILSTTGQEVIYTENKNVIDVSDLPSGSYLIKITSNEITFVSKFLKE